MGEGERRIARAFDLVHEDPTAALALADRELSTDGADIAAIATARWLRGLAARELNRPDEAFDDLSAARELALTVSDRVLGARIATSLALVLANRGEPAAALELLDADERHVTGLDRARLVMQRGLLHHRRGALDAASAEYRKALAAMVRAHDERAQARLRADLGLLEIQRCRYAAAERELVAARGLAERTAQHHVAAVAVHNLGYLATRLGRVGEALELLADAQARYRRLDNRAGVGLAEVDRAAALADVALTSEARAAIDVALSEIAAGGNELDLADSLVVAAELRLLDGDEAAAADAAESAETLARRQERPVREALAALAKLAAAARIAPGPQLVTACTGLGERLARAGLRREAARCHLLAAQVALAVGDHAEAATVLAGAARHRSTWGPDETAQYHLAAARIAEAAGDRRACARRVGIGLQALVDNWTAIGSSELRASALEQATNLTRIGARLAIARDDAAGLLRTSEVARGFAARSPRPAPPADPGLAALLVELREIEESVRGAGDGAQLAELARRRSVTERRIRDRARRVPGSLGASPASGADVTALGETLALVHHVIDDRVLGVVVDRGQCRFWWGGAVDDVRPRIDELVFAIHRISRRQSSEAARAQALVVLDDCAARLDELLVPDVIRATASPLVVVPDQLLHGVLWRCLPSLRGRTFAVSPSLTAWIAASQRPRQARESSLVAGPGLDAAPSEVRRIAELHPGHATVIVGDDATVARTLSAIDGTDVAHLACHGRYRSDNPMFSQLHLADGPLTVYDIDRLRRPPSTVVLSACDAAQSAVLRGGALLGMSSALLELGVSSVIAPLSPVGDAATAEVMVRLHTHLAAGRSPAHALALASTVDAAFDAAAGSFVCLGS